jgi:gamma-glutamyl phosphate reductase
MLVNSVTTVSFSNTVPGANVNAPIPPVDPSKGQDQLQQAFLEALEAFEQALNSSSQNPNDPFKAQALKEAAEKLAAAESALKGGNADDQAMAANFDGDVGLASQLQTLLTVAENPKSSLTDIENAVAALNDPAAWNAAYEALSTFGNSL